MLGVGRRITPRTRRKALLLGKNVKNLSLNSKKKRTIEKALLSLSFNKSFPSFFWILLNNAFIMTLSFL
jgi:hypothetical protein